MKDGGGDAHSRVLSYLRRANRPYSAPVLFENFHHEIGKTALLRVLEDLTAKSLSDTKVNTNTALHPSRTHHLPSLHLRSIAEAVSSRSTQCSADIHRLPHGPVLFSLWCCLTGQAVEEGVR